MSHSVILTIERTRRVPFPLVHETSRDAVRSRDCPGCHDGLLRRRLGSSDGGVRINQIQIIGTHNSYHSGFAPSAAKLWQQKNPKVFAGLDYRHPSLTSQLDAGVRQIEIDIFADTKGGCMHIPTGRR